MKPLFSILLLSSLLFSCAASDDDVNLYKDTYTESISSTTSYTLIETEILDLVNDYRLSKNLSKLQTLNIISSVATGHTDYMIQNNEVSHANFNERAQKLISNTNAKSVSENVAFGYSSAQAAVNGWLNSESHRKIIENPNFTHFGISTEADNQGRNYFTHIFIDK